MAQDHKMNVRRCDQCHLDVNVYCTDFCIKCEQIKCLTHYTKMNSICDQCYDPQDIECYATCVSCNYLNHMSRMQITERRWHCINCPWRCSKCRSTKYQEPILCTPCYKCEQYDYKHIQCCQQCLPPQGYYILCMECGHRFCKTCIGDHDHPEITILPCDSCGCDTDHVTNCRLCDKEISLCQYCEIVKTCRDCQKCKYCSSTDVIRCGNNDGFICMKHAMKVNGKYYCEESCVPFCSTCQSYIRVHTICKQHRREYCASCDPCDLYCKNCNAWRGDSPQCINMKHLCRRCHTCYRCHDPIYRRDPAITSRVFVAWIGLRATRVVHAQRTMIRMPRPVIYMILRMAFTK